MVSKRDISDIDDNGFNEKETKRTKKNHSGAARQHQHSGIDPTWGQKYVFSGVDGATTIPQGEESDFEDDADAMAYLMTVRKEASGIPHLLVAPKVQIGPQLPPDLKQANDDDADDGEIQDEDEQPDRAIYSDGVGDSRGYYYDGAYMALPDEQSQDEEVDEPDELTERAVYEAYFSTVLGQYTTLRHLINSKLPPKASSRLPPSTVTDAPPFSRQSRTTSVWTQLISTTDPLPIQVALLSKEAVFRILRVILSGKFLRRGQPISERASRWLWALLARLPDRGELNHTEIGLVRDLGRRAVLLGTSISEMAALREELHDGGLGVHECVDDSSSGEELVDDVGPETIEGVDSPSEDGNTPKPAHDDASVTIDKPGAELLYSPKENNAPHQGQEEEEGEVAEEDEGVDDDVAMEIESNSSIEEGEDAAETESLEAMKKRLLSQIEESATENDRIANEEAAEDRVRVNMRATLNMILTVTGEFYGQRDLLEFREPFVGM